MPTRPVRIEAARDHTIRARLYYPPSTSSSSRPLKAAVIANPYQHHGGSYNNHVIIALATRLEELGYLVLTFNFRRRKTSWNGHVEVDDMRSTIDWLLHAYESVEDLVIAGYSYGALVASACDPHPIADRTLHTAWLFLSLPLDSYRYSLWMFPKPKRVYRGHKVLGVWGSLDEFAPLKRYSRKADRPEWTVCTIDGCGHFIEDEEHKESMLAFVVDWIDREHH
ncbi:Putative uncharacterized protein [Taphrina deformans PYCC 5710]|uniref:AB hydrolase-1 domain-containing protein n=1 Tax=Taphrina deformans (strain PYCC 5710 / ATCC 11124 / CBS 356.35 / IMI 108563 / JCM 9778 / NBRC 8474) TaxID=1097556 RepID=R4XGQ3_TAPDE|nr:Putative uncharacterized protein [Taphrina deformans PYCC 5710]|eukprot:CCG83657.1 Putative uncharacterized protein [Taphrina deformans PYCC 5710]